MVHLQFFGPPQIRAGLAVAGDDPLVIQPKRLGLLAYLAAARPVGRVRQRDVLIGLFWPELSEERARAALSQAVYALRRELIMEVGVRAVLSILVLAWLPASAVAQDRPPVLDVHLHALAADQQGPPPLGMCTPIPEFPAWDPATPYGQTFLAMLKDPPCDDPVWSPETDRELMRQTIEVMERRNVIGVLSGTPERVATWMEAAPDRFIPGLGFDAATTDVSPDSLRSLVEAGKVQVLAEVTNQYSGVAPDDPRMEPYWELAEELDIPVGIHIGPGPPGVFHLGADGYRARLHSALTLEPVLVRHPGLRVYVMHAGFPMIDDLLALLYAHPQVYVGVGVIVFTRSDFDSYLRRIVEAGHANRVMFGSDQMVWPGVIERAIDRIEGLPFLSDRQKRDILYDNAARFLRLSEEQVSEHHRM